jgi:putative transposase
LRGVFRATRRSHPFTIDGVVAARSSPHRPDAARGWRVFCRAFASDQIGHFAQPADLRAHADSRAVKGKRGVRQRRYWEHSIRHQNDFARHVDSVHVDPAKHALIARVRVISSFQCLVTLGIYPEHCASDGRNHDGELGESSQQTNELSKGSARPVGRALNDFMTARRRYTVTVDPKRPTKPDLSRRDGWSISEAD